MFYLFLFLLTGIQKIITPRRIFSYSTIPEYVKIHLKYFP